MSRKNLLNLIQVEPDALQKHQGENKLVHQVASTVREEKARQARADEIEKKLAEGQSVVQLKTSEIDPSFVQDRMPGDIEGLKESIRVQGQQVPILVRPHPAKPGKYQVAFGHRRLRALQDLGLPINAVVRELSDEQLVVAQGQENNERQDLTYIEKARFAARLNERFSRDVIASSMSLDKSNLSKMLILVDALPASLIDAIGSAPGVGRPAWQKMADMFEKATSPDELLSYANSAEVQALVSEERFKAILSRNARTKSKALPTVLTTSDGRRIAQVAETKTALDLKVDKRAAPEFASFVREHLLVLFEEHQSKLKRQKEY